MSKISVASLAIIAVMWLCNGAQAEDTLPRAAQADTVRKQAESVPFVSKELVVSDAPKLAVEIPEGAENVRLTLKEITIEGSTVYSPKELSEYYSDLVGKEITLADIYIAAAKINQRYTQDGYVLSAAYLPEQEISDGSVKIKITEGYISEINWKGEQLESAVVKRMAERLLKFKPLKGSDLEKIMLELNELSSVEAKAALAPAPNKEPGAVLVEITIERKRISAQLDVNSYASRYLGVWQSSFQAEVSGLLMPVDYISVNLSTSLEENYSRYYRGEYGLPINSSGTTFKIGASRSRSAPGFRLEDLEVRSVAENIYFGVSQPLIRARDESFTLSGQFNFNEQETEALGVQLYEDRLRTLQFSALYNAADNWGGVNLVSLNFFKGLDVFNATKSGSDTLSRPRGDSDFLKFTYNASRLQGLGNNFSALFAVAGQFSNSPLLSSEEFGFGGTSFGRAYDQSELTADEGFSTSLEFRYDTQVGDNLSLQPYIFYDFGSVWSRTPHIESVSGSSAGGGLRMQTFNALKTDIFMAWPLTYEPATPKFGAEDKEPRLGVLMTLFY